jgi:hypothetical protein
MNEHLMTVQELYDFAKKHGFEDATIWIPIDSNNHSSVEGARLTIQSNGNTNKGVYLYKPQQ